MDFQRAIFPSTIVDHFYRTDIYVRLPYKTNMITILPAKKQHESQAKVELGLCTALYSPVKDPGEVAWRYLSAKFEHDFFNLLPGARLMKGL